MSDSLLHGKSISFNGDSICYGAGFHGGYGKIIAERNDMIYENVGVGGATISAETYVKTDGRPRHWVSRTIEKMNPDADFAIVEGGVNDASLNKDGMPPKFGRITEGYSGPFDDTTFLGAFESMLKQLTVRYAGKKIGYIAVHQMTVKYRPDYMGEDNFYLGAKKCCEKWGVPFLDLTASCPPFAYFKSDDIPELYELTKRYTQNGDGWHPNEEGYLRYYCDKIEAWLKTL